MNDRNPMLERWIASRFESHNVTPASSDASFRRYFRVVSGTGSYIVMDAPPDREDCRPFIAAAEAFRALGVHVPRIHESDLKQGFLLLDDLGDQLYLNALAADTVENLYGDALDALLKIQLGGLDAPTAFPPYDEPLLLREMHLFDEWFVGRHLKLSLEERDRENLREAYRILAANALEQPRAWVHRDYHSRNLMVIENNNPGILDFQDAVVGPLTYDLVSLLRDCYIAWPQDRVEKWALDYHSRLLDAHFPGVVDPEQFLRWFDLMGIQRHLKASGIFARLKYRDGKSAYVNDIPRTLAYVTNVLERYPELDTLRALFETQICPAMGGDFQCAR